MKRYLQSFSYCAAIAFILFLASTHNDKATAFAFETSKTNTLANPSALNTLPIAWVDSLDVTNPHGIKTLTRNLTMR
ncbi:MAG: hypothetical protein ACK5JS_00945 [Mangrovibacterium sp.]